jgi:hypothetical protein
MVCDVNTGSEAGSMVKATVVPKDVESGEKTTKHYVPVLELFRGHWKGILIQTCYEACE